MDEELKRQVHELLHAGRVIDAIKLVRNETRLSLKMAKDLVDIERDAITPGWRENIQPKYRSNEENQDEEVLTRLRFRLKRLQRAENLLPPDVAEFPIDIAVSKMILTIAELRSKLGEK